MAGLNTLSLLLFASLAVCPAISPGGAQQLRGTMPPSVALPNTYQHVLYSRINGRAYLIQVAVPSSYVAARPGDLGRYPALYLLDGNLDFPLLFASMQFGSPMQLILVGVAAADSQMQRRGFDYTPPLTTTDSAYRAEWSAGGGAALFLRVLKEEIIPLVDSSYRTSADRGIEGSSYGGLFVAYAMLEEPDLFTRYAMLSPSLWWDRKAIIAREPGFATQHPNFAKHVFLAVGSQEFAPMTTVMWDFVDRLTTSFCSGSYKGLELAAETLAGEVHGSLAARLQVPWRLYPPDSTAATQRARSAMQEHCR